MAKKQAAPTRKRSAIVSYNKLTNEQKLLLAKKYPEGYANFVNRYPKPNGEFFFAVALETEEANLLIKVEVKIDNIISEDDFDKHFGEIAEVDSKSIGEAEFEDNNEEEENFDDKKEASDDDTDEEEE